MKSRFKWSCAVLGAAGVLIAVWHFHRRPHVEGVRLLDSPAMAPMRENIPAALKGSAPTRLSQNAGNPQLSIRTGAVPSFGEQKDLWAFAKQAEASENVAFKYEGYIAARECSGLLNQSDFNNKRVDTALRAGDQGPYLALADLNKRCAGFAAVTPAEGMQLARALKSQVAASKSDLAFLVANRELSDAERQAALRSASPAAMETILPHIQSKPDGAISLAMCDLGKACGVDSFSAQLYCLFTSKCGQPLWADAADEYDPEEWQAIQLERERIIRLMKAGDFQALFKKS